MGENENGKEGKTWTARVTRKKERWERDEGTEMEDKSEKGQGMEEKRWMKRKWRGRYGEREMMARVKRIERMGGKGMEE